MGCYVRQSLAFSRERLYRRLGDVDLAVIAFRRGAVVPVSVSRVFNGTQRHRQRNSLACITASTARSTTGPITEA